MSFCKKCGHKLDDDAVFCPKCSAAVKSDADNAATSTVNVTVNVGDDDINDNKQKKKKGIFKKWWLWAIAVVLVIFIAVVGYVATKQDTFAEYYNNDFSTFHEEMIEIDNYVVEAANMASASEAAEYFETNDVVSMSEELLKKVKEYSSDDVDISKLHELCTKACEDLNMSVVLLDKLTRGEINAAEFNECREDVKASWDEFIKVRDELCAEYGLTIIEE